MTAADLSRGLRLLITARDPGAARMLLPAIRHLSARRGLEVVCAAQPPAAEMLGDGGVPLVPFEAPILATTADREALALLAAARRLLATTTPDAILTGLSGPGIGIDEAVLATAPAERCYSVQDFDGWVPEGFHGSATTYFVKNGPAAAATLGRSRVRRCVAIGAPQTGADAHAWRRSLGERRRRLRRPVTIFFGQPLWHLDGYWRTLRLFAAACRRHRVADGSLLYFPHPKEAAAQQRRAQRLFAALSRRSGGRWTGDYVASLMAADTVVTCYSSAGYEAFQLGGTSMPARECLLLLFDPEVRQCYRRNSSGSLRDLATRPQQRLVTSPALLGRELLRRRIGRRPRRILARPRDAAYAPQLIYETLVADAARWRSDIGTGEAPLPDRPQ